MRDSVCLLRTLLPVKMRKVTVRSTARQVLRVEPGASARQKS